MAKVSIIVPIYNVEKYIERCAESLFRLSYRDVEFIFVNDKSTDKSIELLINVIEKYNWVKPKVTVINHTKNYGSGKARLTGLNLSTGDYVWFVDSDDWIEPLALNVLDKGIQDGADLIMMNYIEEYSNFSELKNLADLTIHNVLINIIPPSLWKFLIKRQLLIDNQILPIEGINFAEDFLIAARLTLVATRIECFRQHLYHYNCININSYMNNINIFSLESGAKAVMIVFDFYRHFSKIKSYKKPLIYMLYKRYIDLYSKSPQSDLLVDLKYRIKECNDLLGVMSLFLPPNQISLKVIRCLVKLL